ncbi:MAG: deoxyguanosinetriphosphate triphosphohydrolase, partial [Oscillospiraceae bacterium]
EQYIALKNFMYNTVYVDKIAKKEELKVEKLIAELYEYFCKNTDALPQFYREIYEAEGMHRAVSDYISGMSDEFAMHTFENLFIPKKWQVL